MYILTLPFPCNWLISFTMPIFVVPFCLLPLGHPYLVNQSMITAIELISGVGPSVCHGTLPLFMFVATSCIFLLLLKHRLPQNKRPSHSFSATADKTFLKQLWWMKFWQPELLHASESSSLLRHLVLSLQLGSICGMHFVWNTITKNAYPRSYCYYRRFLCFDQSDFSCKISLILQSKNSTLDNFSSNFYNTYCILSIKCNVKDNRQNVCCSKLRT